MLVLEPGRAERHYWRDLWHYRELFAILAWRDVAVRYKQTVIGVAWAVVRPLLTMVVFTIVFGKLAGLPSDGAVALRGAGVRRHAALVPVRQRPQRGLEQPRRQRQPDRQGLFPAPHHPHVAAAVVALVDFAINLVILFAIMAWYGVVPGWQIVLLPAFVALAVLASLGPALFITALNVKYRDACSNEVFILLSESVEAPSWSGVVDNFIDNDRTFEACIASDLTKRFFESATDDVHTSLLLRKGPLETQEL